MSVIQEAVKKPVKIKFVVWSGHIRDFEAIGSLNTLGRKIEMKNDGHLHIESPGIECIANLGDVIIIDRNNEIFPCSPNNFTENYDVIVSGDFTSVVEAQEV